MEKEYKRGVTPNFSIEVIDLKHNIVELKYCKNKYELIEKIKKYKEEYNHEYRLKMYLLKRGKWCLFKNAALKEIEL